MCAMNGSNHMHGNPASRGFGAPVETEQSKFAKRTWNVLWNQQTLSYKVGPPTGLQVGFGGRIGGGCKLRVGRRNARKPTVGKGATGTYRMIANRRRTPRCLAAGADGAD